MARPEPWEPHGPSAGDTTAARAWLEELDRLTDWRPVARTLWCEDFCADYGEAE